MIKTIDLDKKPNLVAKEAKNDSHTEIRIRAHKDGVADYRFGYRNISCHYCGALTYPTEIIGSFGYIGLDICHDCMRVIADKLERVTEKHDEFTYKNDKNFDDYMLGGI